MKNLVIVIVFIFFASCKLAPKDAATTLRDIVSAQGTNVPEFKNYLNDYGSLLSQGEEKVINRDLWKYQDSTSNQLAILTLESFDDQTNGPLFYYAKKVFTTWGIGQKTKNNGVLLIVVKKLASKNAPGLRLVTGYGLEGPLPDIACKKIIEDIRPLINKGEYSKGINLAISQIKSKIKGEFVAESKEEKKLSVQQKIILFGLVLFVIGLVIYFIGRFRKRVDEDDVSDYQIPNESYRENFHEHHDYSRRDSDYGVPLATAAYVASESLSSDERNSPSEISSDDDTIFGGGNDDSSFGSSSSNDDISFDGGCGGDTGGGGAGD